MTRSRKRNESLTVASPRPMTPTEDTGSSVGSLSPREPHHIGVPDGGRRAWLVVLGGFINFIASFGLLNSFGTFEAEYGERLGFNTGTVTWIGSSQMFVLFLSGILIGPAFDKWGARKLMLLGTFFNLVSFLSCSFATRFYQFLLAQGFFLGLGCALLFYPTTSAVSEWFDNRRGLALGLVVSGASAGGILWPLVLNRLFDEIGVAWTHRAVAAITIPLMLLSCFLVRERCDIAGHNTAGNEIKASQTSVAKAIWNGRFLGLSVALLFINCGMMVPFYYIPLYAKEHSVSSTMANNLLAISYAASLVGRISTGWVADHIGRFNMLLLISTFTGVSTLAFVWATTLPIMVILSVLFGFSSGGIIPLGSVCVAQTTPDMGHIGFRIGTMMAICSIGSLAGGPATGAIKIRTNQWAPVFIFCASVTLVGTGMLFVARVVFQRRLVF